MVEHPFEKLGVFYLGRVRDLERNTTTSEYVLYDSKDLTTHALCVGMTGSGKTGLCISLLEEAGIDGIPAIVVDPKGDIGNSVADLPRDLRPEDFRPWVDEAEAARQNQTPDAIRRAGGHAVAGRAGRMGTGRRADPTIPSRRRSGDLHAGQQCRPAVDGPQVLLRAAPALVNDVDAFRDRVAGATSGLLALLGVDADPVRSREFILVSNLLDRAWREQRDMDLAGLIQQIQTPPFPKIGVMDVDTFYPAKDRLALSMTLNSLLASPAFAAWLEGDPLDIGRLLYTAEGKPRISILSIAHLSESERMFFVTILLNELLTWVRTQAGTSSLRALFYMDEVFGFFPPVANPPAKQPMLTLLKQARAFGVGLVLATQNPVDLDYKGLSNCGTWFLGRLQTERDKARVLDGLEGASAQAGAQFDRQTMDKLLSALGGRMFLMNNVHENAPVVLQTRWAMSYLRGPLTREQIRALTGDRPAAAGAVASDESPAAPTAQAPPVAPGASQVPPATSSPPAAGQAYAQLRPPQGTAGQLVYRPALLGSGRLHFVRTGVQVDHWEDRRLLVQSRIKSRTIVCGNKRSRLCNRSSRSRRPNPMRNVQRCRPVWRRLRTLRGGNRNSRTICTARRPTRSSNVRR